MNLVLYHESCDNCHTPYQNGNKIYRSLFDANEKYLCEECSMSDNDPDYVFLSGKGVRVFSEALLHCEVNNIYKVIEFDDALTVQKTILIPEFGTANILECKDGKITFLFAAEQRKGILATMDQMKCDLVYAKIKQFASYFLVGKNERVYGFTNSQILDSVIIEQDIIEEEEIQVVKTWDLKEHYDFTNYAISVRQAIKNIDANDLLAYCDNRVQGQGLELRKAVFLIWQYLQCIMKGKTFQAANWFLTTPSGCGKTELYRTIRKYFQAHHIPIPVIQIDLSRITEEGFKGLDPSNIIDLIKNERPETNGYAICFLDEADKKLLPSYDGHGENVNQSVQSSLLTLIEGTSSVMDKEGLSKDFDTNKTMFIFMGAFQDYRIDRQKRVAHSHTVGFNVLDVEESLSPTDSFYSPVTLDDIISYGMMEELAGRIQQVINFRRMSDKSMLQLIRCKTAEIGAEMGVHIDLCKEAEQELLSISFGNLGLRLPLNKIRELVINTIAAAFFDSKITENEVCIQIISLNNAKIRNKKRGIHNSDN